MHSAIYMRAWNGPVVCHRLDVFHTYKQNKQTNEKKKTNKQTNKQRNKIQLQLYSLYRKVSPLT